jgi:hypothetical protein
MDNGSTVNSKDSITNTAMQGQKSSFKIVYGEEQALGGMKVDVGVVAMQ